MRRRIDISLLLPLDLTMKEQDPIRVFADNCIISLSETMQGAAKEHEVRWGDTVQHFKSVGYVRKPLPKENETWKREQIECLPTVGRLARENVISLYSYQEIDFEGWKRSNSFPSTSLGNLFSGTMIHRVEAAVERSYFSQMEISGYIATPSVIGFCRWLLDPTIELLAEKLESTSRFPELLIANLKGARRFRDICKEIPEKQYPDALHLWTAEVNKAKFFLTTDNKFIKRMNDRKDILLPCRPISPSDLLSFLNIDVRDPFPYDHGKFYSIQGDPI